MSLPPRRAIVVGAGGIGSWFTHMLAATLEFQAPNSEILVIDGDSYEPKNAERQTFSKLGNKALVLRNDIAPRYPNTLILAEAAWLVSEGNQTAARPDDQVESGVTKLAPSQILQEGDFVFPLVDNFAARALMFEAAQHYGEIDIITAGNDEGLFGSTWHYARRDGVDITPPPGLYHDEYVNPPGRNPGEMSCEERAKIDGGTQVLAANVMAVSWLMSKVANYMLGTEEQRQQSLQNVETVFDGARGQALSNNWPTDEVRKAQAAELGLVSVD